jgi:hypothetical protein
MLKKELLMSTLYRTFRHLSESLGGLSTSAEDAESLKEDSHL